jgi:hypothetical protein
MKIKFIRSAYDLLMELIDGAIYPSANDVIEDIIYYLDNNIDGKIKQAMEERGLLTGDPDKDANLFIENKEKILHNLKAYLLDEGLKIYAAKGTSLNKLTASYLYKNYGLKFDNPNFTSKKVRNIEFKVMRPENFNDIGEGIYEKNYTCFRSDGEHRLAPMAFIEAGIIPVFIRDGVIDGRMFVGVRYAYRKDEIENKDKEIDVSRLSFVLHNIYFVNGSSDFATIANAFGSILFMRTNLVWRKLSGYPTLLSTSYIDDTFIDSYCNSSAYTLRCYHFDNKFFSSLEDMRKYMIDNDFRETFLNRFLGYPGRNIVNVAKFFYDFWGFKLLDDMKIRFYCVECGGRPVEFYKYIPLCEKHKRLEEKYKCFKCDHKYRRENLLLYNDGNRIDYICKNCYKDYICDKCKKRLKTVWVDNITKVCDVCFSQGYDRCYICGNIKPKGSFRYVKVGEIIAYLCNYCYDEMICQDCGENLSISHTINLCYNCLKKQIEEKDGEKAAAN